MAVTNLTQNELKQKHNAQDEPQQHKKTTQRNRMINTANEDNRSILLHRMLRSASISEDSRIFSMLFVSAGKSQIPENLRTSL